MHLYDMICCLLFNAAASSRRSLNAGDGMKVEAPGDSWLLSTYVMSWFLVSYIKSTFSGPGGSYGDEGRKRSGTRFLAPECELKLGVGRFLFEMKNDPPPPRSATNGKKNYSRSITLLDHELRGLSLFERAPLLEKVQL